MLQEPRASAASSIPARVLGLAGLSAADADPRLPCQVVGTGVPQVLACVADAGALARVVPDYEGIGAAAGDPPGDHALRRGRRPGGPRPRALVHGSAEMGEDPATGSAVGPLCAHVAARTGAERLEIAQGVEMGRPSLLRSARSRATACGWAETP